MSIRASASAQQISPDKMLPLAGYPDIERLSTGVRDPLFASAVHLRGGGAGLVILSLDLMAIDPACLRRIRKGAIDATSTPEHNLFVGVTQTHSAPFSSRFLRWYGRQGYSIQDEEYMDMVVKQAVAAVSESTVTSRPASVAVLDFDRPGTGAILVRENSSGRIMAVIVVHEDIPDYLGMENTELSSDFLGSARKQLAARFGGSPVVCFFPSPQGNGKLLKYNQESGRGNADEAGKALADLIVSKTKTLSKSDFKSDIELSGEILSVNASSHVNIPSVQEAGIKLLSVREQSSEKPLDELNPSQLMYVNWTLSNAMNTLGLSQASSDGKLKDLYDDYNCFQVQKVGIGDVSMLGLPCTMTDECAQYIAQQAGGRLWIAECVNGDMEGGILDTDTSAGNASSFLSPVFAGDNGQRMADAAVSFAGK